MQDVFYDEMDGGDSPNGPRYWLTIVLKWAGAAVSLLLVAMIVLWVYRLGVRDAQEIPVIKAQSGPMRVQPENPGGTTMPNQGLEVNGILGGDGAQTPEQTRLAPVTLPLEAEDTPALAQALLPEDEAASTPPAPPINPQDEIDRLLRQALGVEDPAAPGLPVVRPRGRPENLARTASTAPEPAALLDPDSLPSGTLLLQLGTYGDEAEAERQWSRFLIAHADLLGNKQHFVQSGQQNGEVFHWLRIAGFETTNERGALCEALRARGLACLPVQVR